MDSTVERGASEALRWCHEAVPSVSRTFAITIDQLDEPMSSLIAVGYLLCRVADTIEDEERIPPEEKTRLLNLYNRALDGDDPTTPAEFRAEAIDWTPDEDDAEWDVVNQTDRIFEAFEGFAEETRESMRPPIRELVVGMTEYTDRMHDGLRIQSCDDLDQYCYYVAGTVAHLITNLYSLDADADEQAYLRERAEPFGLMLQLVNIGKDVHDDYHEENVVYLPKDWLTEEGVPQDDVLDDAHRDGATAVTRRVLDHARSFLDPAQEYLHRLDESDGGEMAPWGIPYLLAVATLRELDENIDQVFSSGAVKVTREEVYAIIEACNTENPNLDDLRAEVAQHPYRG